MFSGDGMVEVNLVGVEHEWAVARGPIKRIAHDRMALVGQVHANLVLATREQLDIQQRACG